MKIACFVMMRNESPILGPFLDQAEALFDHCVILNHESTDDSVSQVLKRDPSKFAIYNLKASGYPQSEVATYFAHILLIKKEFDYLFFLDCDEYLPISSRVHLEKFLSDNKGFDVIRLPWVNVFPQDFDGGNIFSKPFNCGRKRSIFQKIILNRSVAQKAPAFIVTQGYHDVTENGSEELQRLDCKEMYCIHIPIQSSIQFGFKLANGNNRLLRERANLEKGNGYHWVDLAQKFAAGKFNYNTLSMAAINYPNIAEVANDELTTLNFGFPYVKNKYCETPSYIAAQIAGLIDHVDEIDATNISTAFTVTDIVGNVEFTSYAVAPESPNVDGAESELKSDIFTNNFDCFEEKFSTLVEPLFNLPTTLPVSAWKGHIPFLFVLFKLLRPKSYVELGVHNGGSLIAACTAAKSYNLTTKIYGVDAWEGDEHAGYYQGDQIFNQLKTHLDSNFRNVELIRNYFADARRGFSASSIDLLHIDGLHTYEAVREDFTTWFGAMAPTGVIMFHDICVFERGFGVHRFWAELKKVFKTIEFHHSHGLGVLFLDPTDSRIAPLVELASNSHAINFYRNLTSAIADTLPERMGYFDLVGVISQRDQKLSETTRQLADCNSQIANYNCKISELESEIIALRNSRSWRITAPLRAMKGYK